MYTCIILHNMILKDQKFALPEYGEIWVIRHHVWRKKGG